MMACHYARGDGCACGVLLQRSYRLASPVFRWHNVFWGSNLTSTSCWLPTHSLSRVGGELVGQSIFECHRNAPEIIDQVKRTLNGETFSTEIKVGENWFLTNTSPLYNEQGEVSGAIGMAFDITERKKIE